MFPFFSTAKLRREQVTGRALLTAAALLFLVSALLSSFPGTNEIIAFLDRSAMAGYASKDESTAAIPSALEEFYDRPSVTAPSTSEETQTSQITPSPLVPEHTSL